MIQKPKRLKLVREDLESQLAKYSRRIQALADQAYQVRQMLERLDAIPKQTPFVKGDEDAVHKTEPS